MKININSRIVLGALLCAHLIEATPFAYVGNTTDTTVSVIDIASDSVIKTIDLGTTPEFDGVAISPDGAIVYVTCYDLTTGTVQRIDTQSNTVLLPAITIGAGTTPYSIAIAPNNQYAYVSCSDNTVKRINLSTNAVDVSIAGFSSPRQIAITPNGVAAYVSNVGTDQIIPIDLSNNTIQTPVPASPAVGFQPETIAITSDSAYAYVAGLAEKFLQLDLSNPLSPIATTITLMGGITLVGAAITNDNKTLYLTNTYNAILYPVDISNPASPAIATGVTIGSILATGPWTIALTPDNTAAYIANQNTTSPGTVTKMNITNRLAPTIITAVNVGNNPIGIAITPFSLTPPTSVSGCKTKNVFLLQTDYINKLTWSAPTSGTPTAYKIYRDAYLTELAGTVSASGTLEFYDHDRNPNIIYTYYITAVDSSGAQSDAASVTVTTWC